MKNRGTNYQDAIASIPRLGLLKAENTHILRKGKYQCTAGLMFNLLTYNELTTDLLVWSNPNQSNRRSAVQ